MGNKAAIASIVVGSVILIVGVIVGWWVLPDIVHEKIGQSVELKEGTEQYERFEKMPIPFDLKVYMFHVTNKDKVLEGEQPIVEERGPYIYSQNREKKNIVRDDKKRTISYYEHQQYEYNQELSKELKQEDPITVLSPALNGAIQIFEKTMPDLLQMLDETSSLVFGADNIFLDTTVGDFLFGGIRVCDLEKIKKEPNAMLRIKAQMLCTILFATPIRNMQYVGNSLQFTFLNHKNITHDGHYTVNNGMKYREDVALIQKWQDSESLNFWQGGKQSACNRVTGHDGVIFPPYQTQESIQTVFNTDICRTVDLKFDKTVQIRDVTANEYILDRNTFSVPNVADRTDCYCLNVSKGINNVDGCLKHGVLDLYTCYNAPIVLSFPHFLWADEAYQTSVQGLAPKEEEHRTYARIEPETGTPLVGAKRVQFNMFIRNVQDVATLSKIKTARLVPVLWLDEYVEITDELYDKLYDMYIKNLVTIDAVRYSLVGVGAFVIVVTLGITLWRDRRAKQTV